LPPLEPPGDGALDVEAGGAEEAATEAALENIVAMVVDTPAAEKEKDDAWPKPPCEDFWKKPTGASEAEEEVVTAAAVVLSWNAWALLPIETVLVPLEMVMVT
jgi:hypothetical protein